MISFRCEGKPIGKQRPRFGKGKVYTPDETTVWETQVGWAARVAMRDCELLTGSLSVKLEFWRKDKRRVDIDNLAKAALDSCNGIVWSDDSQIVHLEIILTRSAGYEGVQIEVCEG